MASLTDRLTDRHHYIGSLLRGSNNDSCKMLKASVRFMALTIYGQANTITSSEGDDFE